MPKGGKEKKPTVNIAVGPSLVEGERALELYLIGYTENGATPDVLVLLRINNEQHSIVLRDAIKEALTASAAPAAEGDPATLSSPPMLQLSRQLVQVTDRTVRDALLNCREANRIDVCGLPGVIAASETSTTRRQSRSGERRTKAAAAAGGSKGKGSTAGAAGHPGPPDGACCLGGAAFSLIPFLTSTSVDVTVPLAVPNNGGITELRFRVCCRDAPLLTPQGMLQSRPVVLRVGGLKGLPSLSANEATTTKDGSSSTTTTTTSRLLHAQVRLGNACVRTPALSVAVPVSTASNCVPPRHVSVAADSPSFFPSATFDKLETPVEYHEHVLFLSDMGDPLEVYRQLHSTPCTVSLWQSFNTATTAAEGTSTASPLKGQQAKKVNSETLLGSGGFSVRDFLSDDQVRFSEAVQLLPDRSTVSLAGGQTCLTTASTITVALDFFQPFPPLQHVDETGGLLSQKAFLTHSVLRLPYQAAWMSECLGLLLQEVRSFPRATADVHLYTPPPPSPSAESEDVLEKTTSNGRGAGGSGSKASTTGTGVRSSKKKVSSKPDMGSATKVSSRAGAVSSTEQTGFLSPHLAHRFDAPLQLISPPGLSGFEVADGTERLWCLEGTVREVHHVLARVMAFLEAHHYPQVASAVLFNAELFVPTRAYLTFPALVTPPAGLTETNTSSMTATAATAVGGAGAIAMEVEPSGTGGRFHRIRLRTPLATLCQTQAHYLRHTLSDECLDCLRCLHALLQATSMREVAERGWLPAAPLLIALERSFGQTLEKEDLYGATPPPSPTRSATPAATSNTGELTNESMRVTASLLPRAAVMDGVQVGALVSFDGAIHSGGGPHRPIPPSVRRRFSVVSWMVVAGTGEQVLCAFAHSAPTSLVRYHVEGQVVQTGAVILLYVVKCVCLARSFTNSHNAEYEQLLRERQHKQQTHLMRKTVLWPTNASPCDADARELHGQQCRRNQQNFSTVSLLPAAPASTVGLGKYLQSPALRSVHARDSEEDEADGDDWLASDFYDHLDSASSQPNRALLLAATTGRDHCAERSGRRGEKGRAQTRGVVTAATHKAITDEELWRMYDERAPAATALNPTIAGATGSVEKLPPLHH